MQQNNVTNSVLRSKKNLFTLKIDSFPLEKISIITILQYRDLLIFLP